MGIFRWVDKRLKAAAEKVQRDLAEQKRKRGERYASPFETKLQLKLQKNLRRIDELNKEREKK